MAQVGPRAYPSAPTASSRLLRPSSRHLADIIEAHARCLSATSRWYTTSAAPPPLAPSRRRPVPSPARSPLLPASSAAGSGFAEELLRVRASSSPEPPRARRWFDRAPPTARPPARRGSTSVQRVAGRPRGNDSRQHRVGVAVEVQRLHLSGCSRSWRPCFARGRGPPGSASHPSRSVFCMASASAWATIRTSPERASCATSGDHRALSSPGLFSGRRLAGREDPSHLAGQRRVRRHRASRRRPLATPESR